MKKLLALLVVLVLIAAGLLGYLGYHMTHIFVEDAVYPKNAQTLDLRGTGISIAHYETLRAQLPDCEILWDVPLQDGTEENSRTELELKGLTEGDLDRLRYFPGLKTVIVTDCQDYVLLEKLQSTLPEAEVIYSVDVGGTSYDHLVTELELAPGTYDYDTLTANIPHMPRLKAVSFPRTKLDSAALALLQQTYPDIAFTYTVEFLGQELESNTTTLDLSAMTSEQVDQAAAEMPMLTALESVQLSDALTMEQVKLLKDAAPQVKFHYSFQLLGKTVTTDDEVILFKNNWKIRDDDIPQLRLALDIMNNCTKLTLDNTGVSNAAMAQLREDYRGKTEVVWRVWFGQGGTCLTDVEVLRIVYGLGDDNCSALQYLEKVRYMDLGHNEFLDYCDFIAHMPELEVCIISGAPIKSLEPFKNCTKLKFLEIANCIYLPDLEPLRSCKELEMLNIAHTKISDLSPIADLPLTHLCSKVNLVPDEDLQAFIESHPNCWVTYQGTVDYTVGWRYDEENEKLPWYDKLSQAFGYPNPNNNTGWYLK